MKIIFCFTVLLIAAISLKAQQPEYKVVFDMSTRDSISQLAVLREVDLIRKNNPAAKLEVVIYGQAMNMAINDESARATSIKNLLADSNTSFKVCAFTMKRFNVDKNKLVPGIQVVADGIYEIISKQHDGWGYIKVAH